MAWDETNQKQYTRPLDRFEADVSAAEWAVIAPLLPPPSKMGRRPIPDPRDVFNAIQFMLGTGCQWRAIPKWFPPFRTVTNDEYAWRNTGVFERMLEALRDPAREQDGRSQDPAAAAIDRQSVATTESGGPAGSDAGKKIKGRKRPMTVDPQGSPMSIRVHEASVPDRDGLRRGSGRCGRRPRRSRKCGRTAAIRARSWPRRWPISDRTSSWRLCANHRMSKVSSSCIGAGSSSAPSPGGPDADVWRTKETRLPRPVRPGQPGIVDYEYERNGTAHLFLAFAPNDNWRTVKVTDRRTARDGTQFIRELADDHFPGKKIVLVMDNLNTHGPASWYEAFAPQEAMRVRKRFEFRYPPKHGSWLHRAEIEIGA